MYPWTSKILRGFLLCILAVEAQSPPYQSPENTKPFDIFGEALLWHVDEKVEWAYTSVQTPNSVTNNFQTTTFDWDVGFRVGLGYTMDHDTWDTRFYYTRFHTQTSDRAQVEPVFGNSVYPTSDAILDAIPLVFYEIGTVDWDIDFDMFDWELARRVALSPMITLRPNLGIKGGWINQTYNTAFHSAYLIGEEEFQNNFWGIGSKFGIDGKWQIGKIKQHTFSLLGSYSAAFLWGHWTFQDTFNNLLDVEQIFDFTETIIEDLDSRNFGALMLQSTLGIAWNINLNKAHFCVQLGYEFQSWLNQFQLLDAISGPQNKALNLQGVNFNLSLDF